jgi:flagellar biosynthesis/type III secretory pathway ATPase
MEIVRYGDKCIVKQDNSSKLVEAEVLEFKEKKNLIVVLNKSVKLNMTWNGKMYEGRMAGIDFVSDGPTVNKSKTSRG